MIKTLNNGNTIPIVGLGTWQSKNDECFFAVQNALACGYTHIDSAHIYNNHEQVAKAIKAKNVDRSKLFITSKLPPAKQGYEQAIKCFEESLKQLGTDYLGMFYSSYFYFLRLVSHSLAWCFAYQAGIT